MAQTANEQIAAHFLPDDQLRRGHRLFLVDRVTTSNDLVTMTARQIAADGTKGAAVELTFQPGEILRRITL